MYGETKMLRSINLQNVFATKLTKGLLDLIVLQFLSTEPMHGYQIMTKIRKNFGVYVPPSSVYPLLNMLEKNGFVNSEWSKNYGQARKIYSLTRNGQSMLDFTEEFLILICRKRARW